jgi:hypothetical protein
MFEEEGRGLFSTAGDRGSLGKNSVDPVQHEGLNSGEIIVHTLWDSLVDPEGKTCEFEKVHKGSDIIAIYCDPRYGIELS